MQAAGSRCLKSQWKKLIWCQFIEKFLKIEIQRSYFLGVLYTQKLLVPDDDDVHAGDLDGDAPPVHEARHVHTRQQHTQHHEQGPAPAACREGVGELQFTISFS